jgi:hypothetical protein
VISLVSHKFYEADNEYPPQRKIWQIFKPVDKSMVNWFIEVAGAVKTLTIAMLSCTEAHADHLQQLLAFAATFAPNLTSLGIFLGIMTKPSCASQRRFLSHISKLCLSGWSDTKSEEFS